MKSTSLRLLTLLVLMVTLLFTIHSIALAHGSTQVENYELVIGFHNEPAFQGEPNGLDLFVTNADTDERVNGLEETLEVEIIFGSSQKALAIRSQFGQDGAYTADVLPTESGDYTWHIFGTIEGTPVDVSMTSSPDTFGAVRPKSEVAFPSDEPATAQILAETVSVAASARTASIIAAAGVLLGAIGILIGFIALRAARR
jgi:hypothetical protein